MAEKCNTLLFCLSLYCKLKFKEMKSKIISAIAFLMFVSVSSVFAQYSKECNVDSFNKIKLEGSAQWVLVPSDHEKVEIESDSEEVSDYVEIETSNNRLVVSTTEKTKDISKLFKSVTITIYFKDIDEVAISGVGSLKMTDEYNADEFTAILRGTGDMNLNLRTSSLEANVYGTGNMEVEGRTQSVIIKVEGVGAFDGFDFESSTCTVTVSGVGAAEVYASETLNATINGVGSIRFKGDPETKNFQTNGLGSIKKAR
jgi:hypothetical protein